MWKSLCVGNGLIIVATVNVHSSEQKTDKGVVSRTTVHRDRLNTTSKPKTISVRDSLRPGINRHAETTIFTDLLNKRECVQAS
jgi:transcription elongation factor